MKALWLLAAVLVLPCTPGRLVAAPAAPPELPASLPSPITEFRRMLALPPAELERELAARPEAQRRSLEAKLSEYRGLSAEARELRLQATELRWYLRPLMSMSGSNRLDRLRLVPSPYREWAAERLLQWDALPAGTQAELLKNEKAIGVFLRAQAEAAGPVSAAAVSPTVRGGTNWAVEVARWNAISEARRREMCAEFQRFFELPAKEQTLTLRSLSAEERQQMEATLAAFAKLPPAQRALCLTSFRRFADLTPVERAEFLRKADLWRAMSPEDRALWRRLVTQLPPMPPGYGTPPMPGRSLLAGTNAGSASTAATR
jgi:hypothetical protein